MSTHNICVGEELLMSIQHITKTRLFKYTENFTTKNGNFSDKKF